LLVNNHFFLHYKELTYNTQPVIGGCLHILRPCINNGSIDKLDASYYKALHHGESSISFIINTVNNVFGIISPHFRHEPPVSRRTNTGWYGAPLSDTDYMYSPWETINYRSRLIQQRWKKAIRIVIIKLFFENHLLMLYNL
jgi:hypothetical protein